MSFADELMKAYEPTKEDIARKLTNDQLIKLCRRNSCRVDMWRWNYLNDIKLNLQEAGRFERKSKKFIKKLLIKAALRDKEEFQLREEELIVERKLEWAYRKKESLMQLELWEYLEKEANKVLQQDQNQMYINNNNSPAKRNKSKAVERASPNSKLSIVNKSVVPLRNGDFLVDALPQELLVVDSESMTVGANEGFEQDQNQMYSPNKTSPAKRNKSKAVEQPGSLNSNLSTSVNITVVQRAEAEFNECANSKKENQQEPRDSLMQELLVLNSESMTVGNLSEISTGLYPTDIEYQPIEASLTISQLIESPEVQVYVSSQSQSQTYDDFHERLPMSSTQDAVS